MFNKSGGYLMYKLFISLLIFSLISCFGGKNNNTSALDSEKDTHANYINRKCIKDRFAQGQDDDLYGLECIENKQLIIETSNKGSLVSTSEVTESETGLKLEENLSFKNKFYNTHYDIKETKGDAKDIPFLLNFLPSDEEFTGDLNTSYHIIFKTWGNYLVLFKASQNLNKLPDTETTSLKVLRGNKLRTYDPADEKKGDYYMVPFIGYPIKYCKAETIINKRGERTFESRSDCEESYLQNAEYIEVNLNSKQNYNYLTELKKDLFPSEYFEGLWYFSRGPIETPTREGEIAPLNAYLVKMEKEKDSFSLKDMSGKIETRNRRSLGHLPVKWLDFETNQRGNNQFISFGEKEKDGSDHIKRPYAQIDFKHIEEPEEVEELTDLIGLTITSDYFSFIHKVTIEVPINSQQTQMKTIKWKTSFLRAKAVDTAGFIPKRWFINDHKYVFGILPAFPQKEGQRAEDTENELLDHGRMIRFNTSLNTDKEQKTKTKIIEWRFSKNSTKDPEYRASAQKAVDTYNQAFKYLTRNSDKKIKIELITNEEKELGDLRYNIINLVKTQDLSAGGSGLLGIAPSYVNPDTGQIIGTTSNIIIHNQEDLFDKTVRNYIRYEIFQKDRRTDEENEIHVTSFYLRSQIQEICPEVGNFIKHVKNIQSQLKPRTELSDKQIIISCGKKLTQKALLGLILHEMGHSFGLAHNFKASVDSKNYYQSEEEIKAVFPHIDSIEEIAKSSSVMDYTSSNHPEMKYLGKYDLAALRYLYLDKIELKDGTTVDLKINPEPKLQKSLTTNILEKRKNYLHCTDSLKIIEPLCYLFDYGSNPKEIAENDILNLKRKLNSIRYRYDLDIDFFTHLIALIRNGKSYKIGLTIAESLHRTSLLYNKWLELRSDYLESIHQMNNINYILNDKSSISKYEELLKKGLNNKEYALYYPMRDTLPKIVTELMSLEEMKCHVKDFEGKKHNLALESIKNLLKYNYGDDLYVEDCSSSIISNFFSENNLTLINQTGYENFSSYYPKTNPQSKLDVIPINQMLVHVPARSAITNIQFSFIVLSNIINPVLIQWLNEPDLLRFLTVKAKKDLLDPEKNKTEFGSEKNIILFNSALSGLISTLTSPDKKHLLTEHLNNTKFVKYEKGTSPNSFYKQVIEPLSKGLTIEDVAIPFLTSAHKQHAKENSQLDFISYLMKREDIFNNSSEQTITIPFQTNSFSADVIKKYNETSTKLEDLENRDNLSDIEELHKEAIKQHNRLLYEIMENQRLH